MLSDQLEVDAARVKAGGVCLTCKTPYAPKLEKELAKDYYSKPYQDIHAMIPEQHRKLGVACIDCHDNKDMSLRISREFTLVKALKDMGEHIARMRKARHVLQAEAALRANISRETASRIENGDAAVAIGQVVRYLDVIAPGATLGRLYETQDAALAMLEKSEKRQRARTLSPQALKHYEF